MQLKMYFPGYFFVKMEGASVQKTLSICSFRKLLLLDIQENINIESKDLETINTEIICKIPKQQYEELTSICQKTDTQLSILSEHGFCHMVETVKRTYSFWLGLIICLCLLFFFQTRIWDIRVVGNIYYDSPILVSFLTSKEITPGINKNNISCIELADEIRQEFPKIKWTSVELKGTNLIIHIKENLHLGTNSDSSQNTSFESDAKDTSSTKVSNTNLSGSIDRNILFNENDIDESELSNISSDYSKDIIAEKGGIIKSIYVRSGIANIKAGDTCKKGDILVKGQIPIYNDSQEIIRYEGVDADADIILQYDYAYYDSIERKTIERIPTKTIQRHTMQIAGYHIKPGSIPIDSFSKIKTAFYSLIAEFKNKFNLNKNVEPYFEQQTEYKQLKITPTFTLPIYWGTITTYEYEEKSKTLTEKETKELLQQEFSYFCEDLEKKGGSNISK